MMWRVVADHQMIFGMLDVGSILSSIERKGPDWTPALNSPCGAKQARRLFAWVCLSSVACLSLLQHQLRAVHCCPWPMKRQWQAHASSHPFAPATHGVLQTKSVPLKNAASQRTY